MPPVAAVRIKVDDTQLLEHAHREGHRFQVVPFVIVKSALEHDRRHPAELAQKHFP